MKHKLVSVNVTTYNRVELLERCIDSILRQTYPNLEVIVVDDCSTDHTSALMDRLVNEDKRIRYIRHDKNKGNAHARNTALQNCRGYYVAFMDDDDEWIDPEKLSKQVNIFENSQNERLGIVCSGVKIIDAQGHETERIESKPKNLTLHLLKKNGIIHNSTVLTKRDIMLKVGGFDIKMPRGVDSEFFRTVVVKYKYDVHFMPDVTAAYHEHNNVRMTTNKKNAASITMKGNLHVIAKHFPSYLAHPSALLNRIYTRTKKIISYYI